MECQTVISHLSDDQVEELYRRYIDGERNTDLVDEYKIDVSPNNLIKVFPPVEVPGLSCPYCNVQMYQRRKSKGAFASGDTVGFCSDCEHKSYVFRSPNRHRQCGCSPCTATYQQLLADRERLVREEIYKYWGPRIGEPIRYAALDLQEKVYLVALINAQANVSFTVIKSAAERRRDVWLAPSASLENEILMLLYRRQIIVVDPESPASAFDSNNIGSARVNGVRWIINVALDGDLSSSIDDVYRHIIKELSVPVVDIDSYQLKAIAKSVLTEQAIQQIHYQCGRLSLPFSAEKKSRDVVGTLLHNHSLAVVCYFAYLAARRASDYYLGASVSKTQASNIIPGKMQEYGLKAVADAWDLASKRYLTADPRSELSKVLFDLVLGAQDEGVSKKLDQYFSSGATVDHPSMSPVFSCPVCGSIAVHASVKENCIIVDCKDCISRSPVTLMGRG